jgi:uncharacterized membrane protein
MRFPVRMTLGSKRRSLAKACLWTSISLCLSVLVVWIFTDDVVVGIYVALVSNGIKGVVFYCYERTWIYCSGTRATVLMDSEMDTELDTLDIPNIT